MARIRGWKFPIQLDKDNGRIATVEDNENIKQSVRIILLTQIRERKLVPNFGTNIRSFLFNIVDPTFVSTLKKSITNAIRSWEKHIKDLNVSISTEDGATSRINVDIDYITDIAPNLERVSHKMNINE